MPVPTVIYAKSGLVRPNRSPNSANAEEATSLRINIGESVSWADRIIAPGF
jgi:hypothetical protein